MTSLESYPDCDIAFTADPWYFYPDQVARVVDDYKDQIKEIAYVAAPAGQQLADPESSCHQSDAAKRHQTYAKWIAISPSPYFDGQIQVDWRPRDITSLPLVEQLYTARGSQG